MLKKKKGFSNKQMVQVAAQKANTKQLIQCLSSQLYSFGTIVISGNQFNIELIG